MRLRAIDLIERGLQIDCQFPVYFVNLLSNPKQKYMNQTKNQLFHKHQTLTHKNTHCLKPK